MTSGRNLGQTRWTDEERAQLVRMMNAGLSFAEIAQEMGRSRHGVTRQAYEIRRWRGIHGKPAARLWTPEETLRLCDLLTAGKSGEEAAAVLGRSPMSVYNKAAREWGGVDKAVALSPAERAMVRERQPVVVARRVPPKPVRGAPSRGRSRDVVLRPDGLEPLTTLGAVRSGCRWPYGDARAGADMPVCGRAVDKHPSWCPVHIERVRARA